MEHTISILFFTRIASNRKGNLLPIYFRITVNGQRIEQSTHRFVQRSQWSSSAGRAKANTADAKALNDFLDALRNKVHTTERAMVLDGIEITYQSFKENWFRVKQKTHMVLEVFRQHNDEVALLSGKDFSPTTVKRYTTSLKHTRNFIEWKYKVPDIDINKLNYEFISSYAFYLKSIRNCNHNSTMKYLTNLKRLFLFVLKAAG